MVECAAIGTLSFSDIFLIGRNAKKIPKSIYFFTSALCSIEIYVKSRYNRKDRIGLRKVNNFLSPFLVG